jgi:glycosyltransferase involved in cell wall biosynthesis
MDYSDVTVVIPVKDEPATEKVTKAVMKTLQNCKVIVIYNGKPNISLAHKNLRILKQTTRGKGHALVEAAKHVNTKIMCIVDGDDTYEIRDLKKLVELVRGGADMAIGDRMSNITLRSMPTYVQFGNNVLTFIGNLLFGMNIKDSQTGLRAIKTGVFRSLNLREPRFGIESEMNIKCKKNHFKIVEIPTRYYIRTGVSKQLKLLDGAKLFLLNFKLLFQ